MFREIDRPVLLVLVGFSIVITALNIGGPFVFHFIDILWPLDPSGFLTNLQYAWNSVNQGAITSVNAFNIPTAAWLDLLAALGIPIPEQELLTLATLQIIGGYGFYALVRRFVLVEHSRHQRAIAVVSSICYVVNYYALVVGWWDNIPGFFFLLAFTPMFLYFALSLQHTLLQGGRPRAIELSGLAVASFLGFSTNVPFNLSLLSLALLVPPLAIFCGPFTQGRMPRALVTEYFLLGVIIIGTSLWWIIPDYLQSVYLPGYIGGGYSTSYNLSLFVSSSTSLTSLTVFTGLFGVEYPAYAHNSLSNFLYQDIAGALAILVAIVVLAGTVLAPKGPVRTRQSYLLGIILVLSLFFLGVNSPIAPLLQYLLESNSIALQALRNPFLTFGFALSVLVILAFLHGLHAAYLGYSEFAKRLRTTQSKQSDDRRRIFRFRPNHRPSGKARAIAVATLISLVFLPLLASGMPIVVGNAVPSEPYEARMIIPTYEYDVASYLRAHLNDTYALLYPGGFLEQNWTNGYDGYDILPSLLPQAFLIYDAQNGFVASPNSMLSYAYSALQTGTTHLVDFAALLNRLGVSTIVVEGEVGGSYPFGFNSPPNYPLILGSLNQTPGLHSPLTIGPDYIYVANEGASLATTANASVTASALVSGTMVPEVNLTSLYANATTLSTPLAPSPAFSLYDSENGKTVTVNATRKQALMDHPLASPLGEFGQPIVFNGAPIPISTSEYDSISVSFSTNSYTALTISVVDTDDLAVLNSTSLESHLFALGGPSSSLGYGTASLFPAYGADHYWTNGTTVTLTDDLRQNVFPSNASTVYYLLFSMFPVLNGQGTPGIPVSGWSGNQSFTIQSILLGNPFYAPASSVPGPVSVALLSGGAVDNLTKSYVGAATEQNASVAPAHNFVPSIVSGYVNATLNQSVKTQIGSNPLGPPFGQGFPPSIYNGVPLTMPLSNYDYIDLNFSTNAQTAVTFSLIEVSNLTQLNQSALSQATLPLGGSGNSLGYGDPSLFPSFGADHFVSVNHVSEMTQQLSALTAGLPPSAAYYLVASLYPVAPNGTGIRFVPVQDWPGVQQFGLYGLELCTYLVNGSARAEPPSFFGPAPRVFTSGPSPFAASTAIVPQPLPTLEPVRTASAHPLTPSEIQLTLVANSSSEGPFLVILHQNFADEWTISGSYVARSVHLEVDAGYNGFLVYLDRNETLVTLTAFFSGQVTYELALLVGLTIAVMTMVSPPLVAMIIGVIRSRRNET